MPPTSAKPPAPPLPAGDAGAPRGRSPRGGRLTRDRVVGAALDLVDRGGIDALSMRSVAAELGVEAMSLYRHVSGREDLVLAVADRILDEVELPPPGAPWREAMRRRARSTREVFLRHPSAAIVTQACATMTPARLRISDAVVGLLLAGGFDPTLAYRALLVLDSYVYGFMLQELGWPHPSAAGAGPEPVAVPPEQFPHFAAVMGAVMGRVAERGLVESYADEFAFGLELVLDALDRRRTTPAGA